MTTGTVAVLATDALTLELEGGTTLAHNMGCGIVVVDQPIAGTKGVQRVVLSRADLEALLVWIA